jgi:hypothetical protein
MDRHFRLLNSSPCTPSGRRAVFIGILPMSVSKVVLNCSVECARLARQCRDEKTAVALFAMSARLLSAANRDAELMMDEVEPDAGQHSLPLMAARRT